MVMVIMGLNDTECTHLESRVIACAVEGTNGDWVAYIGAACDPAKQQEENEYVVRVRGNKLPEAVARAIFPYNPWRDLSWRR
jgi:hypothetical protein